MSRKPGQAPIDEFQTIYNQARPHRALNRRTPQQAYDATIKATPATSPLGAHYRIRIDTVDRDGKVTLRRAGQLHHLGIGRRHAGSPVLILVDPDHATVTHRDTGEILGTYTINPDKNYWPDKNRRPGRWPGPSEI